MKSLFSTVTMLWVAMFLLAPLAQAGASEDLTAFKEVQQTKLDAQKELHQKDVEVLRKEIEAVNKRVDDQLTQVGQAVDRYGVATTWIGLIITALLVLGGFLGYRNAKAEAKDAAKEAAKSQSEETVSAWFDQHAQELQNRIAELDAKAHSVHHRMEASAQAVESRRDELQRRLQQIQVGVGKSAGQASLEQIKEQHAVQALATQLEKTGEDSYSFDDWNTRAHAAYAKQEWEQAAYFWRRASDVPNAGAVNVARVLFNRGITQDQLGRWEEALKTYDEVPDRFGDASDPALREMVAQALVNKGSNQSQQGRWEEAINTYDEVLRRFGEATEPELREQVARALLNRSVAYDQLGQREEAIKTSDELLRRFSEAPEPALREQVAGALNLLGFARLMEAKQEATREGPGWLESAPAQALLQMAMANLSQALERREQAQKPVNGFILGNRAYVRCLLGQIDQAKRDFSAGLYAPVDGGQALYVATLKDMDIHPIEQDQIMRDLVEKAWGAYQKESSAEPPAQ